MITGELPYTGDSVHTISISTSSRRFERARQARRCARVPDSRHLRALSKESAQRFDTMEEFATAVWPEQPVAAPSPGRARASGGPRRAAHRVGRCADRGDDGTDDADPACEHEDSRGQEEALGRRHSRGAIVVVAAGVGWLSDVCRKSAALRRRLRPRPLWSQLKRNA